MVKTTSTLKTQSGWLVRIPQTARGNLLFQFFNHGDFVQNVGILVHIDSPKKVLKFCFRFQLLGLVSDLNPNDAVGFFHGNASLPVNLDP